jgi:hypothetical protein
MTLKRKISLPSSRSCMTQWTSFKKYLKLILKKKACSMDETSGFYM